MSTEYSISVSDWNYEDWEFTGRNIEYEKRGEWSDDNEDGISEDECIPVMLYAYPLYDCPSEEEIFKIHKKTCLTVVQNIESEEYYLALCGGGMDCSQDVGMAYIIAENNIPYALAQQVCRQPNLTQHGADFRLVMKYCQEVMKNNASSAKRQIKEIKESMKQSRLMEKHGIHHVSGLAELEAVS